MPENKNKNKYEHIIHPFPPLYDEHSEILILGSLPSVKSREAQFFYAHPQNRFWKVLAAVLDCPCPADVEEKKRMLHGAHIALWDTIASCELSGSSDSSIRNVVPTDLNRILTESAVSRIYCNGKTSAKYFEKYQQKILGMEAQVLPSTSPANAAYSVEKLISMWAEALQNR